MGFFSDTFGAIFGGSSNAKPAPTQSQVNQASEQIAGLVENKDLLQDKAPIQVNDKFADFIERNTVNGVPNSAAQAILNQYDSGLSNYQVAMEDVKNMPGGKQAFNQAFPNPLVQGAQAIGNYIQGGGILGILPNLMSNVNEKLGGIFNQEKPATDMGTTISSMDQADLDALKGPSIADVSGPSTSDGTFKTAEEAIAASGLPASEFAPLGITNPNLIQANSLLNFNDLLQMNENIDAQSIANAYKALTDNQGFDVQDNQLQYNQPLFGGNLQFGVGPNNAGIMFSKGFST